jgi:hypothetical protein
MDNITNNLNLLFYLKTTFLIYLRNAEFIYIHLSTVGVFINLRIVGFAQRQRQFCSGAWRGCILRVEKALWRHWSCPGYLDIL